MTDSPAPVASIAAAGGFTAARADLARGEKSLRLLLEQRDRRGHFKHLDGYATTNTTGMVGALLDAMNAIGFAGFRGGYETVPEHLIPELGTAPFTVRALIEYRGDSIEWFIMVNPLAERPHLYWGPVGGENTTADLATIKELQDILDANLRVRFALGSMTLADEQEAALLG